MATPEDIELNSSKSSENEDNTDSLVNEVDRKFVCTPCEADGRDVEAVGYCVNCKEYLCKTCFKYHRLPSVMRKHVLINQEQMVTYVDEGDVCSEHTKRVIEYHCPSHSFLGCHVCFFHHQKSCHDTIYIPDISELVVAKDIKEISAKLDYVATKSKTIVSELNSAQESIEEHYNKEILAIKAFKAQLIEIAEVREKELIGKAEVAKETELMRLKAKVEKCKAIEEANLKLAISLEAVIPQYRNKKTMFYLAMVKSKDTLLSYEVELNAAESDDAVVNRTFVGNTMVLQALKCDLGIAAVTDEHSAFGGWNHGNARGDPSCRGRGGQFRRGMRQQLR